MAIHEMKSAAQSAKDRQRGLSVLERQAEGERIAAEKEAARRQRKAARRSQSTPPQKDKNGGELARGRGRQRINQTIGRSSGGSGMLERRSRSLMSKKDFRRSVLVNAVAPAGGAVLSRCPERTDDAFEQGTAAGTAAHAEAVRAWIKGKSGVGCRFHSNLGVFSLKCILVYLHTYYTRITCVLQAYLTVLHARLVLCEYSRNTDNTMYHHAINANQYSHLVNTISEYA